MSKDQIRLVFKVLIRNAKCKKATLKKARVQGKNAANHGISFMCELRTNAFLMRGSTMETKNQRRKVDLEDMDLVEWFLAIDSCIA